MIFSFNVPYFGALYFENYGELDVAPLRKVGVSSITFSNGVFANSPRISR